MATRNPKPRLSTTTETSTRPQTRRRPVRPTDPTGRVDIAAERFALQGLDFLGDMLGVPGISDQLQPIVHRTIRRYLPTKPVFTRRQLELAQAQANARVERVRGAA